MQQAEDPLQGLNPDQTAAVLSVPETPLCIFAGAGSGKTRTLCRRIAYALSCGEQPDSILCLTFSRNAADELRHRVGAICSDATARQCTVATFHSFCLRVLRQHLPQHHQRFGYSETFTICDREEQDEILSGCLSLWLQQPAAEREAAELKRRGEPAIAAAVRSLSRAIETQKTAPPGAPPPDARLQFILGHYGCCMRQSNMVDFSDLLLLAVRLFEEVDGVADLYCKRFSCVFIDEFQDTTLLQLHLIRLLGCPRITVVGDDDQSIYGFRGAQPDIFNTLREMIAPLEVREVVLGTNYRSTNCILEASTAVVGHNTQRREKWVQTPNPDGPRGSLIHVCSCRTVECETAYVADQILEYQSQGVALSAIAVLHRIRSVGPSITKMLGVRGVAYHLRATSPDAVASDASVGVRGQLGSSTTAGRAMALLRLLANPRSVGQFKLICNSSHYRFGLPPAVRSAVLSIAEAGSGQLVDAARTLLHLPLDSPAYAGLPQGTKRSLGEMLQSLEKLSQSVSSGSSSAGGSRQGQGGGGGDFSFDYQTNQLLLFANAFSPNAKQPLNDNTGLFATAAASGGGDTGLSESSGTGLGLLREFLDHVADLEREDAPIGGTNGGKSSGKRKKSGPAEKVTVSTVHRAKGLEWDIVFVVRMNEGVMPLQGRRPRSDDGAGGGEDIDEEERRIAYVAMSRARHVLHLSFSEQTADGEAVNPSRFLADIPKHCVQKSERLDTVAGGGARAVDGAVGAVGGTQQLAVAAQPQRQSQAPPVQQQQPQRQQQVRQQAPQQARPQQQRPPRLQHAQRLQRDAPPSPQVPQHQGTLDTMLPNHAARASRLEQAARQPAGVLSISVPARGAPAPDESDPSQTPSFSQVYGSKSAPSTSGTAGDDDRIWGSPEDGASEDSTARENLERQNALYMTGADRQKGGAPPGKGGSVQRPLKLMRS